MTWLNGYRMKMVLVGFVAAVLLTQQGIGSDSEGVPPIANAGLSRYAGQDPIVLDGTGSYDPNESGPLSYSWQQISGPTLVISDANTDIPTISGFVQTEEIQECEFELIVSDGELTSLPDAVKVIVVPTFTESTMVFDNEGFGKAFDPQKPTVVYFGGAYSSSFLGTGGGTWGSDGWREKANVIYFDPYYDDPTSIAGWDGGPGMTFSRCADMIIVYLSAVAPDYKQAIQTMGLSLGGVPAIDVALRLNKTYADARYAVNRVSFLDATTVLGKDEYSARVADFLANPVVGEQCWLDSYRSRYGGIYPNVMNVYFTILGHTLANDWYQKSLTTTDMNVFNNGVIAGSYWSVVGPGKNLQLASTPDVEIYKFIWSGDDSFGHMDFYDKLNHPSKLPEPVTLIEPVDVGDPNGLVLTCKKSENAVGYELLFGTDPYRIMDYEIISDTPAPPNDVITTLPYDGIWWTVRVRDQYGSTIYADPKYFRMFAHNPDPADGCLREETWIVSWSQGLRSVSYDVYFSDNFNDVNDGTAEAFWGNQITTYLFVGFAGFPYPDGLVPGTSYFWRIDDVRADGTVIHKGNIWRFTVSL